MSERPLPPADMHRQKCLHDDINLANMSSSKYGKSPRQESTEEKRLLSGTCMNSSEFHSRPFHHPNPEQDQSTYIIIITLVTETLAVV